MQMMVPEVGRSCSKAKILQRAVDYVSELVVCCLAWLDAGYVLHWPHGEPSLLVGPTVSVPWLLASLHRFEAAEMLHQEVLVISLHSDYLV
jgi:hypothetical protein